MPTPLTEWEEHQAWEANWHGNCVNSYREETKQIVYAKRMGLNPTTEMWRYPTYDLQGKSVIDIGGGAYSMLLKTINGKELWVADPGKYPKWTVERYKEADITYYQKKAEEINLVSKSFDEVWIYNCLQHTIDPEKIIQNAKRLGKLIRIFEWIDIPPSKGHPHELKEELLNKWLGGIGQTEQISENGAIGRGYFGIFPTNV